MKLFSLAILAFLAVSDVVFPTTSSEVFAKYLNKYFVETGSNRGDGIQKALNAGFQQVYSIELSEKYYHLCQERFALKTNVGLWLGDSADVLPQILELIDEEATFWLDGHFSYGDTAKGKTMTPLLKELEAIKNHPVKSHTILIDDVRLLGTKELDKISIDQVIDKLKEINSDYVIAFEDGRVKNDVLIAHIPK